jgi:short-subunit dehydrogenase
VVLRAARPLLAPLARWLTRQPPPRRLRRSLDGRVVLITGASRGIGARLAVGCGAGGAHVLLVARDQKRLEQVADDVRAHGGRASVHPCDLADLEAVTALAHRIIEVHGGVDVLVNNAAHSIRRAVIETDVERGDAERLATLNYLAPARLMVLLAPGMAERGDGHVVQVSTVATLAHPPLFAAYTAAKAALEAYGRTLAAELRHRGVAVSVVHLPLVRTDMIAPTEAYRRVPTFSPDRGAAVVLRALVRRSAVVGLGLQWPVRMADAVAPGLVRWAASLLAPR